MLKIQKWLEHGLPLPIGTEKEFSSGSQCWQRERTTQANFTNLTGNALERVPEFCTERGPQLWKSSLRMQVSLWRKECLTELRCPFLWVSLRKSWLHHYNTNDPYVRNPHSTSRYQSGPTRNQSSKTSRVSPCHSLSSQSLEKWLTRVQPCHSLTLQGAGQTFEILCVLKYGSSRGQ